MARTKLDGAVGERPKPGNKTFNKPEDVKKVQSLLNRALGQKILPTDKGKCGYLTVQTLRQFSKAWGDSGASVWPGGTMIKRLDRMATELTLNKISLGQIKHGGYLVSYKTSDKGPLPKQGYQLFLCVGNDANRMDVTGRKSTDLIGADNLPALLKLIENQNKWAATIPCFLALKYKGHLVSKSKPQDLQAPVKPHAGNLGRDLLDPGKVGDWTYGADDKKGRDGRYLWTEPMNKKYYFAYAGKFATLPRHRGLVCITYLGAVYGVSATENIKNDWAFKDGKGNEMARVNVMSAYGTQLAVFLKAKQVDMEAKKAKEIKEFFKKNPKGPYMMWKEGHTVLVVDGKVHEFTNAKGTARGFRRSDAVNEKTPGSEYSYGASTWWIRQLGPI